MKRRKEKRVSWEVNGVGGGEQIERPFSPRLSLKVIRLQGVHGVFFRLTFLGRFGYPVKEIRVEIV